MSSLLRQIPDSAFRGGSLPFDPSQRHQIEQDALIALLREIADLETDDDGDVILGADENGH